MEPVSVIGGQMVDGEEIPHVQPFPVTGCSGQCCGSGDRDYKFSRWRSTSKCPAP